MVVDFIKREIMPNLVYYLIASLFFGLGITFLKATQIITGGFPGLALIINYFLGYSVGTLLVMLNTPLFIFGYYIKGMGYFLRVLICTVILSIITDALIWLLHDSIQDTPFAIAAIFAGITIGIGTIIFVRYKGSPGGLMILTQWVSERFSIPLGYVVFAQDFLVTVLGIGNILTWQTWGYSLVTILTISLTVVVLRSYLYKS